MRPEKFEKKTMARLCVARALGKVVYSRYLNYAADYLHYYCCKLHILHKQNV